MLRSLLAPRARFFIVSLVLCVAACDSGSEGDSDASVDADGAVAGTTGGGGNSGTQGTAGASGSSGGTAGASGSSGTAGASGAGGAGGTGAAPTPDEEGKPALGGMDGITGLADGTEFTYRDTPTVSDYSMSNGWIQINAKGTDQGDWTISFPAMPGTYTCGMSQTNANATLSLNSSRVGVERGTATPALGGECVVVVGSVTGAVVGSFSGIVIGTAGTKHIVTAGYFSFSEGLADCSTADDPGVTATDEAGTVSVEKVTGMQQFYRCGTNSKLPLLDSKLRDIDTDPYIRFMGDLGDKPDVELKIEGLYGTGTFDCGVPGSTTVAEAKNVQLIVGLFSSHEGGVCEVKVTKWEADLVEGTYTGAIPNLRSVSATTLQVSGSFRGPRFK